VLNQVLQELRREFAQLPAEKIVRAADFAAKSLRSDAGPMRLRQRAREALRRDL
jgi:hypothetical protein